MLIAGIGNFVKDTSNSLCFAGIANVISGSAFGMQVAGISNTTNGNFLGAQISGIANIANGAMDGLQIAGISNVNSGDLRGAQVAGISNFSHGDLAGAQIGLINHAKKVSGFQIGFINIADTLDKGVSLAFIPFVRKGYHCLEVEAGDAIYASVNFKLGTERLYTIYKGGFTQNGGTQAWSYGLGLGTKVDLTKKFSLSLDLTQNQILQDTYSPKWNLLSKFDLKFRYTFGNHFTLFAGPSVNGYLSEHDPETEKPALNVPYSIHTWNWWNDQGQSYLWIGGSAGMAVKF